MLSLDLKRSVNVLIKTAAAMASILIDNVRTFWIKLLKGLFKKNESVLLLQHGTRILKTVPVKQHVQLPGCFLAGYPRSASANGAV